MNDFWFTWANTSERSQTWSFLDGGNYFDSRPTPSEWKKISMTLATGLTSSYRISFEPRWF